MAACASCGRGDLMQAQIRTYQCLACGAVTDENSNEVTPQEPGPNLSNANLPVTELGEPAPVDIVPAGPEAPVEAVEVEEVTEAPEPEEVEAEEVALPIDISTLTPEQIEALKAALD